MFINKGLQGVRQGHLVLRIYSGFYASFDDLERLETAPTELRELKRVKNIHRYKVNI